MRVDDGGFLAGIGMSDEQPILFSDGRGPDGLFDQVVINSGASVSKVGAEGFPLIEQVSRSLPEELVGQRAFPQNQSELMEPLEGAGKVFLPAPGAFHGVDLLFIALTLQLLESADEPESDPGRFRVFGLSLTKKPRLAWAQQPTQTT